MKDEYWRKALQQQRDVMAPFENAMARQQREWEAMRDAMEPHRRTMQALADAMAPSQRIMKQLRDAMEPARREIEAVKAALEPMRREMDAIRAALEPKHIDVLGAFRASAGLDRLHDQLSAASMVQTDVLQSFFEKSERLSATALLHSKWMRDFEAHAQINAEIARVFEFERVSIDMPAFLPDIIEPDPVVENGQPVQLPESARRDRLAEWWNSLSLLQRLFLLCFIQFVIQPAYERLVLDKYLFAPDEASRTTIANEVDQSLGKGALDPVRCVRAKGLNVRSAPSTDAAILGQLTEGQAVETLEREGGFWRIRYVDVQTGEMREGWAATSRLVAIC